MNQNETGIYIMLGGIALFAVVVTGLDWWDAVISDGRTSHDDRMPCSAEPTTVMVQAC